ncbi:MAG: hypothetical protein HQK61_12295, partial [Desulfamplus sp.]|nr:hypothetical protein [Desulfamplus sp.]
MEIKGLNQSLIRRYSDISTYNKGEKYLKKGNILSMEQHGGTLCATIKTENRTSCETTVLFDSGGIIDVTCTCEGANWCEHVVATLLGAIQQPYIIKHHLDLKELVRKKSLEELKSLILKIADNNADMEHLFVKYLSETDHVVYGDDIEAGRDSNMPLVDPVPFAKKIGSIIKKYENRSNSDDAIAEISDLVDEALEFVSNGDGSNALVVMEAIINGYVKQWMNLDGSMSDTALFFEDLDMALSKSILMTDNTRDETR